MDERTELIRKQHASAKPTDRNPAWLHTHRDCAYLLGRVDALAAALQKVRFVIEEASWISGYGFHRPANPHHFQPDMENTEEEHAAHKAACEAFDRGEYNCEEIPQLDGMHILMAPWGPGSYQYQDEEDVALLAEIDTALTKAQS